MKIRTALDCYATIVILRAGGCYDVPTIDTATGADERAREWIEQARIRMDGWHEADKKKQLYHDEAVDLSIADVLLKVLENGAPKAYRGRPIDERVLVAAIGARGGSTALLEALNAQVLMDAYCHETGQSLESLKYAVMRLHPRKGRYAGVADREKHRQARFEGRFRKTLAPFYKWCEVERDESATDASEKIA